MEKAAPYKRQLRLKPGSRPPAEALELFAKEPELDVASEQCLRAWSDLASERHIGMSGAGAIPFTAALAWCRFRGLDDEATRLVWAVIRDLDHRRAEAQQGA